MKDTISQLTVYDIGADDHDVWLRKDSKFGFNIEITDEDGEVFINENIHPYAAEAMAHFCKRYLAAYEYVTQDEF